MTWRAVVPGWLVAVLVGACASSSQSERPEGPPPQVLFPSPLALLLEHHTELQLTTEQLIELDRRETALQEKNRPLREKLQQGRGWAPEHREAEFPPPGDGMGRRRGRGIGGMGGMSGHGTGGLGGGRRREGPPTDEDLRQREAALRELEDNESAAYNEAEQLLDEKQKAQARELVSQQREERLRVREAMKGRGAPPEK